MDRLNTDEDGSGDYSRQTRPTDESLSYRFHFALLVVTRWFVFCLLTVAPIACVSMAILLYSYLGIFKLTV